jgi:hypothetical protein
MEPGLMNATLTAALGCKAKYKNKKKKNPYMNQVDAIPDNYW